MTQMKSKWDRNVFRGNLCSFFGEIIFLHELVDLNAEIDFRLAKIDETFEIPIRILVTELLIVGKKKKLIVIFFLCAPLE